MNKLFSTLVICLSLSLWASAQNLQITGTVIEQSTQTPLEFAEVALLDAELAVVTGTILDTDGRFELQAAPGAYRLTIYYLGAELLTQNLQLEADQDLGTLEVQSIQDLDAVTVTGKKKLIQRKIDRLVFNVESSSRASQGDALEVLRVTPGVRVQNDRITMIGKSTLQVMVNDKIINLSNEDLANFLRSIPSQDIQDIEVITTPPAKYDALGNSGLINIVLKEAKADSWNAQAYASYRQRRFAGGAGGGSFNFNKNKFSLASSLNYWNGYYYQEQDDYAYFPDGLWYTSSPFKAQIKGLNGRADLNYQVGPNWSMGAQYMYAHTDYAVTDQPYTPVFDYETDEILRYLQSEGTMDLRPEIHSVNYNNAIQLDTLGRSISINLDYFTYRNPDTKTYVGESVIAEPPLVQYYQGINTNRQDVVNYSGKVDFDLPTSWANLGFGAKISTTQSFNDIEFFNSGLVAEPVSDFMTEVNDFEYDETIEAAYVSAAKDFSDKWSTQLGLRLEATQTNSFSENLKLNVDNDYVKLFPSFYLAYNQSAEATYSLTYSRRIERPGFFDLNPNIYFINPFQTIEGNAFLQPAFVDNVELSYTYKNYFATVYYSYEDNMFAQVPLPNASTNIIRFTNENYINTQRLGLSQNLVFDRLSWWTSNNSLDVNFTMSEFDLAEEQADQRGINAQLSTYNDFTLNKAGTLYAGINYWYSFPGVDGIFNTKSASSFSVYLQMLMLEKKLSLTLRGNDLFKSSAERTETTVNNVFQTARYYYDNRFFQVSLSYKFGNDEISAKRHDTGNQDEKARTGN